MYYSNKGRVENVPLFLQNKPPGRPLVGLNLYLYPEQKKNYKN